MLQSFIDVYIYPNLCIYVLVKSRGDYQIKQLILKLIDLKVFDAGLSSQ